MRMFDMSTPWNRCPCSTNESLFYSDRCRRCFYPTGQEITEKEHHPKAPPVHKCKEKERRTIPCRGLRFRQNTVFMFSPVWQGDRAMR